MAKIKKKDLEALSSEEIRGFFTTEDNADLPTIIKGYIDDDSGEIGNRNTRINRVERLLMGIIVGRFIKGDL